MQFRVVIPEHVKAGQTIRIHCPDGTEANVRVPDGLNTGDSFIFEMSVDQLKNPQALLNTLKESSNSNSSAATNKSNKGKDDNKNNTKETNDTTTSNVIHGRKRGFLDREIVNVQDFLLALFVGLIIGVGIVLGFILGVLAVTTPDDANATNLVGGRIQQQVPLSGGSTAGKNYVGMPQHGSSGGSGSERLQSTVLSTPATPDDQVLSIKEQIQQRQKQQQQKQQQQPQSKS